MPNYKMVYTASKDGERMLFQPEFTAKDDSEARTIAKTEFMSARSAGGDPSPIRLFKQVEVE